MQLLLRMHGGVVSVLAALQQPPPTPRRAEIQRVGATLPPRELLLVQQPLPFRQSSPSAAESSTLHLPMRQGPLRLARG